MHTAEVTTHLDKEPRGVTYQFPDAGEDEDGNEQRHDGVGDVPLVVLDEEGADDDPDAAQRVR